MKPIKFKPSQSQLLLVGAALITILALEIWQLFTIDQTIMIDTVVLVLALLIFLLLVFDLAVSWQPARMDIERAVPSSLSLGKWVDVTLMLRSRLSYAFSVHIREDLPASFKCQHREFDCELEPNKFARISYKVKPTERGNHAFLGLDFQKRSVLGFWLLNYRSDCQSSTRVYPNFSAISGYSLLHTDNQTVQLGIKKKARRGEGMDFLQLREYREGDSLRQIDWKASSRYQKLISQEYQDARDQQVLVMLDSGRRMRTQDDELSHFDHSLNATLLLSHIALKQGDSVSLYSFGSESRFVPAFKGAGNVQHLLNEVYDLYPSNEASDYLAAAQSVSVLNRKRSLIVIVSNLRDEDLDDLLVAIRLLQQKHLVLVANLIEDALVDSLHEPIAGFDSAVRYAGLHVYKRQTEDAMEKLKAMGVWLITCRPSELSIRVVNSYLQIKNSAML